MKKLCQVGGKGPHQPFGQLLQRRSDWIFDLPKWSVIEGGLPKCRFSSGEAARRADEVLLLQRWTSVP